MIATGRRRLRRLSPLWRTARPFFPATMIAAGLLTSTASAQGSEWTQGLDGNWYALTFSKHDWQGARNEAINNGAELCSIHSEAENAWIVAEILSQIDPADYQPNLHAHAWIGFTDQSTEGQYEWSDGSSVTFSKWAGGEPNNGSNNEDCAVLNWGNAGGWNDVTSSDQFYGVMELVSPDCDGNGVPDRYEGVVGFDCNGNGICDSAEIANGHTPDANSNQVPDDCEAALDLPYGIDSMVVLGDSLSDTGNLYALMAHPASPPNFDGRFSNGPVWVEFLAGYLGLSPAEVANFAYGGASTGNFNTNTMSGPGLLDEVEEYEAYVLATGAPTPETLFVLWVGAADFESTYDPSVLVGGAMANIEFAIRELVQLGARRFLVPNLPDLGSTPRVRILEGPEIVPIARAGSIAFNAYLGMTLATLEQELAIDVVHFDVFSLFDEVRAHGDDHGWTDVDNPCIDLVTGEPCAEPDSMLFWDELHPTTGVHQLLAQNAQVRLLSGGDPLHGPPCFGSGCPKANVTILSPSHGDFTTDESIAIIGTVDLDNILPSDVTLYVNDTPTPIAADGSFYVDWPLAPSSAERDIVCTVREGFQVLDRDRVVVFQGESIAANDSVSSAVVAHLTKRGIGSLRDELAGRLMNDGVLDIQSELFARNPIAADHGGVFQYDIFTTAAGFLCSSIEIIPQDGSLFVALTLHDLFIDYDFHGWLEGIPDPGFDCSGRISASNFSVYSELGLAPSDSASGAVEVTQLTPFQYQLWSFDHSGSCATLAEFIDVIPQVEFSVEQKVIESIEESLSNADDSQWLSQELEEILASLSVSGPVGDEIGIELTGDMSSIAVSSSGVAVSIDVAPSGASSSQRTYAPPVDTLPFTSLDPVEGAPYDFAPSVSLRTLNQLLLERWAALPNEITVAEVDLGLGPIELNVGALATLIPQFVGLDPRIGGTLTLKQTLPPMVTNPSGGSPNEWDIYLGQLLLQLDLEGRFTSSAGPVGGRYGSPRYTTQAIPFGGKALTMAIDLNAKVEIDRDQSGEVLVLTLAPGVDAIHSVVVENPYGIDESVAVFLFQELADALVREFDPVDIPFPLPSFAGLVATVNEVASQSGYVSPFLDVVSGYARPDLIIESVQMPPAIDVLFPFGIPGMIKNIGRISAFGGAFVGASLSVDSIFGNWDDFPIATPAPFVSFGDGLNPGEALPFLIPVDALGPDALMTEQTIFVLADLPPQPGGTGNFCETSELNNTLAVSVLTTVPDAYVSSVSPPEGAVGGIGPLLYWLRVGRNDVGIDEMSVPIQLSVGSWTSPITLVTVPRGTEVDSPMWAPTPASFGNGGQINYFPVLACTWLDFDSNTNNNCATTSVGVAAPWWDLRFDVVGPSSAASNSTLAWEVRCYNAGNAPTDNVCAFTRMCLSPGAGNYQSCYNAVPFVTPNIGPGETWTFSVQNYQIWNAAPQQQYLKAEINYNPGNCHDAYVEGNYDHQAIQIHL